VLPWLQAFDIFVLPSYANEGVPQAIMQAMACALPVVTTPVGSIAEIVAHERTGLLVEPKNSDQLGAALERLSSDAALRQRLGAAARDVAAKDFRLDLMVDRMQSVFADLASAHARR
jgi:glycosyltransferase involved in cell wall biosynthesis